MAGVTLEGVTKTYGAVTVIPPLDLTIHDREFVVLVGPSGCGKTTTLRMIAGLETASGGRVAIGGREVTDLRPGLRNCSMVFQNYALYPHMSVAENISYGMRVRGVGQPEIDAAVSRAARILNLEPYLTRRPKQLSGGQRQRVAIGRAIVREPDVFLFDEPLSNLDAKLRIEMRTEIKALHRRLATTIVYVTHDQIEAMTMADRVVVMNGGRIEQAADPITLYEKPDNLFVAAFIGAPSMNFLEGTVRRVDSGFAFCADGDVELRLPEERAAQSARAEGQRIVLGIRPEHVAASGAPEHSVTLKVRDVEPLGPHTMLIGQVGDAPFTAQVLPHTRVQPDDTVSIPLDLSKLLLFDKATGKALDRSETFHN
ncbi:sn-glycerol-3-phosphate ABC transporter ATP-binding protein UgpC [Aureimonas flava]|uniref:sn-glycerol-3-phosphate ABC transporter ATP-binding protein UgpC n=1 Tax=Aureimonas flava TaxID=2320271 RepID=A0A3A1WIB2_9HYPH|nr:sn-glycerol-3-phosphate ABC transporter ATP-binding protein UgpC [Aureimonas flava]RIX98215.1 sn-glycerol-3-phosphate ABC transporter ATP-binding protein UgpC [Aureimonas flava]